MANEYIKLFVRIEVGVNMEYNSYIKQIQYYRNMKRRKVHFKYKNCYATKWRWNMFTILIVEDSKEILDLMVLHLEDKYNLTCCAR